jgi:hypothetical protein
MALGVAVVSGLVLAALGVPGKQGLPVLDWAARATLPEAPLALLIELGSKDIRPQDWSGKAGVKGARLVSREGYGFEGEDKLIEPDSWSASTHRALRFQTAARPNPNQATQQFMVSVGVVLRLTDVKPDATLTISAKASEKEPAVVAIADLLTGKEVKLWQGLGLVRRVTAAVPVGSSKTEDDFPSAAHGPDGTLWLAYTAYRVREEARRNAAPPLDKIPDSFKGYDQPGFADQLFVRVQREGKWSEPVALTGASEDLMRAAVAVTGEGVAWVVYSAQRGGQFDLYARPVRLEGGTPKAGEEQRLTNDAGADLFPVLCTDSAGGLVLAWQTWSSEGQSRIGVRRLVDGAWKPIGSGTLPVSSGGNCWHPAVAAGPKGEIAVAYDVYHEGDYDVHVAVLDGDKWQSHAIATSPRFEARPSIVYDVQGRLWIAYEDGPELWGKDYGILDAEDGNPLYAGRSVRVVCLHEGKLLRPAAELPSAPNQPSGRKLAANADPRQFPALPRYSNPALGLDGQGRLWLTYRQKFGRIFFTWWETFARRLDGDHWSEPVLAHHSDGLLDRSAVVLPGGKDGVLLLHAGDGRRTRREHMVSQVALSRLSLPGDVAEPKLVPHQPGTRGDQLSNRARAETAAVQKARTYRLEAGGKRYQLVRGEFHRHTEMSFDGGADGSLEDMFRYAIDPAGMDWIGSGDHEMHLVREYQWWLIQKYTDAFHTPGRFTPMFTFERSVPYPHGHRNCVFANRGIMTLPRLGEPNEDKRVAGVHADDTKMLYRYLHALGGVCAVHTSATSMGTDWRDNDPVVEPMVEIYQGDRMSYEKQEAPRAGYDPKMDKKPANIAGWYPDGYIDLALQKGYKLGFQSSSDHWSTHISYCVVLAEKNSRAGILDAMRKRHCYGATDDIIVEFRSGDHIMGDAFRSEGAPQFQIRVVGTRPVAKLEILRDSVVVETVKPDQVEFRGDWADPRPATGEHYYYLRITQSDDELAWSSPIWVTRGK